MPERGDKPYDQILLPAMHWLIDQVLDRGTQSGFIFPISVVANDPGTSVMNVVKPDTYSISEFTTSSKNVRFEVIVHNGSTAYMPAPTANGVGFPVSLYQGEWKGYVDVNVDGINEVVFNNGNGVTWSVVVTEMAKPVITSFTFTGGYPGSQVELKQGDKYSYRIISDVAIKNLEFADYGASGAVVVPAGSVSDFVGEITAPNRGIARVKGGVRVRVQNVFDTWSDWLVVDGNVDGLDCVYLNNAKPMVGLSVTGYPGSQQALKGSEGAAVTASAADYDDITFSSPNGELDVSTAVIGSFSVFRISGTYNVSVPNISATARRAANGSQTTATAIVKIANVPPSITVTSPARMRSGVSPQSYSIMLSSTQSLSAAPLLFNVAGTGTLGSFSGSSTAWTASYTVPDSATKGTFAWSGLQAVGLSGLVATSITTGQMYTVGGFTMRVISVPSWPARSAAIGTVVSDTSKLKCTNLSKGASGSYNFLYQSGTSTASDRYTITGGNTWYNCDTANASSNTTSMNIEIEESV